MGMQAKPNIVFVLCDNVGWGDFSCYGGSTATPRNDKLADEGIRFTNYTVEFQCTPTRSAILTGRQSVRSGHLHGADTRPGTERPGAVGVHDRRAALGRGLRDVAVGQVASRRRRGAAAERSGLRRVVGL